MQALVLDFDGVISDSAPEAFRVARQTYADISRDAGLPADEPGLYRGFLELMPLGNRAEDYGVILRALEAKAPIADQADYDAYRRRLDRGWLRAFHERFYQVRTALMERDAETWYGLLRPYPELLRVLRRHAGEIPFAIATAKDRRSVGELLRRYGVADLFGEDLVLDKETGVSKRQHLLRLHERLGVDLPEMTFVDDKVNHLDSAAPLGVRCALAAWGYNGAREHALARERKYLVCHLDDVEPKLFGTPGPPSRPPA